MYSRVDNADTTLQTVVEGTLASTTSKNLGLDDHVARTWGALQYIISK